MEINLNKFGTTLSSREDGSEALKAFQPSLKSISNQETIVVNFDGVNTFTPSWADEFITPLYNLYKERLVLLKSENLSVKETLKLLERINKISFIQR